VHLLRTKLLGLLTILSLTALAMQASSVQDFLHSTAEPGRRGGRLVIAQSAEPKTLNPVIAIDQPSRNVIRRTTADLIHINRYTQKSEPALAKSWTASADGKTFTLQLRRGLHFSDGAPFDADDVIFSFKVYLDEKVHSPQRDLLLISGQPIKVEKLDAYTVRFAFPAPYAAAERVFDEIPMLPRHLLEKDYEQGNIARVWNVNTTPDKIAGMGPFRFKQFAAGERIVLERNPYYWKVDSKGQQLPYLDELIFLAVPTQDAQVIRFEAGDTQIINTLSAENFAALFKDQQSHGFKLYDVGPGLEYNFLMFNLNDGLESKLPEIARKQRWFNNVLFRQAVSAAIDRETIVRLVYRGRGAPVITPVSPGNKLWIDTAIRIPQHSVSGSKELLRQAGFSWKPDGTLIDSGNQPVEFTILVSSSNTQRVQMATLVQDDLRQVGMKVSVVTMEYRAALDRILSSHDYETALIGWGSGDVDPTSEMNIFMSSGESHLWHLDEKKPATTWEAEIDQLMQKQMVTMKYVPRKKMFDRVQEILAQQLPIVCLASPHILTGARENIGNFRPAILDHYTLWNSDELFWRTGTESTNGRKR
jgi:peptide/nickel transport system substrate-binding protein